MVHACLLVGKHIWLLETMLFFSFPFPGTSHGRSLLLLGSFNVIYIFSEIQCSEFGGCLANFSNLLSTSFIYWRRPFNQVNSRTNSFVILHSTFETNQIAAPAFLCLAAPAFSETSTFLTRSSSRLTGHTGVSGSCRGQSATNLKNKDEKTANRPVSNHRPLHRFVVVVAR